MRLLLIDTLSSGHHIPYLQALLSVSSDVAVVIPSETSIIASNVYHVDFWKSGKRQYLYWLREINRIIRKWKPDVVHFVYGDDLYRYMGMGIKVICKNCKTIVTFHQVRCGKLRDMGKMIFAKQIDAVVVHTEQTRLDLLSIGIKNTYHVEYPQFCETAQISKKTALEKLGISGVNKPVLLAIGGTRWDKGLDLLLDALTTVRSSFYLLVAGKEQYFTRADIESRIATYAENVTLMLKFLSDEMFSWCLSAADIVVLPYRKQFDGASGPLSEGVWHNKMIVGANHGSLGRIISDNHLGMVFESENVQSLSRILDEALSGKFVPDEMYVRYRNQLNPEMFKKEYCRIYSDILDK